MGNRDTALEHGTRRWGRILDEIGTLSTVPGQNRDEKVGMVHGRLAYMRQVADSSKVGAVHTALPLRPTIVAPSL